MEKRTTLKQIQSVGSGLMMPPYKFEYWNPVTTFNATNPVPDFTNINNNGQGSRSVQIEARVGKDGWYNGRIGYGTSGDLNIMGLPNQDGLSTDGNAWNIKKITYPTGAVKEFTYETDKYQIGLNENIPIILNGGGIRLKSQTINDGVNNPQTYTYEYHSTLLDGSDEDAAGRIYISPSLYWTCFFSSLNQGGIQVLSSVLKGQLDQSIMYGKIIETQPDNSKITSYYSVRKFDDNLGPAVSDAQSFYEKTLKNRGFLLKREYSTATDIKIKEENYTTNEQVKGTYFCTTTDGDKPMYISVAKNSDTKTTTIYDQNGLNGVTSTVTTEYSLNNGLPSKIAETNSDGKKRITRMTYPGDYYSDLSGGIFSAKQKPTA